MTAAAAARPRRAGRRRRLPRRRTADASTRGQPPSWSACAGDPAGGRAGGAHDGKIKLEVAGDGATGVTVQARHADGHRLRQAGPPGRSPPPPTAAGPPGRCNSTPPARGRASTAAARPGPRRMEGDGQRAGTERQQGDRRGAGQSRAVRPAAGQSGAGGERRPRRGGGCCRSGSASSPPWRSPQSWYAAGAPIGSDPVRTASPTRPAVWLEPSRPDRGSHPIAGLPSRRDTPPWAERRRPESRRLRAGSESPR